MNRIVPLILAVALFMEQMDSTVIATALPAIATDLGVGPITLKLALTSYMVALAIFIPISGWMADRHGAKRIFRMAILVFIAGSIACAFSASLPQFVLSRFLQGMGGAMMTPVGRLVLLRTTKRSELVSAMAWLTVPGLIGPLTGPPIGGFITTWFSWHWIFLINVPVGILGYVLSGIFLPDVQAETTPPLDIRGFFLSATAAGGVIFGLSVISLPALPPAIGIVTTFIGLAAGIAYVAHARATPAPVISLKLFANDTFRRAVTSGVLFRIASGAIPFLMPLMLQLGFGLSPFQSGMITFIGALGAITTKFIVRRVLAFAGFRTVLLTATLATTVATIANAFFTPETPYALIFFFLFVAGLARSFFFTSSNTLSYAEIDNVQASQASTIASVAQQISLALGVATAAAVLEMRSLFSGSHLALGDFHIAFLAVAALSLTALPPILRLPRNAGASVSGHAIAEKD